MSLAFSVVLLLFFIFPTVYCASDDLDPSKTDPEAAAAPLSATAQPTAAPPPKQQKRQTQTLGRAQPRYENLIC